MRELPPTKSWNSHQPRLGIAPLARFRGPIARFGANSLPGRPVPLGRRADGPSSRRAAEPTSRRARERQETEPDSPTPSTRAVLYAPSEMPWPCAAVFRHLSPLVAHSARAWPFTVATATQFRRFKRSRLTGIGAPSSPSGSDHSAATEEPAQSVPLPPTSPHAIVWCGGVNYKQVKLLCRQVI